MSENFTNILTKIGQQKKALAEVSGTALNIITFKVGDGNGAYYEPNENQTALVNTKYTGTFVAGTQSQIVINPAAANEVLYKCFIPADIGGFTIRELGLFDDENDLILICKLPAQDKFALASGLYQPLTFTPKIIYTNPQTQAVLTPTSQTVPTAGEVTNMITQNISGMNCSLPIKNTNGALSLEFDTTLKLLSNKLSVDLSKIIKTDGTNKATSLLGYAAVVSASADLDIPSFKNVKDYITGLNYLKKDGTVTATSLLSYASIVTASADLNIPSYKNVKDYVAGLNYLKKDGTVLPTSLLVYAAAVAAAGDQDIPSYKNVKDYITAQNFLKKDGTVTATALLSYASSVSASADLNIPSYKNVKDYVSASLLTINNSLNAKADSDLGNVTLFDVVDLGTITSNFTLTADRVHKGNITAACTLTLPSVSTKFHNLLIDFTLASGISLTIPTNISWNYGIPPSLSNTLVNRFIFDTKDGGTTWKGYYSQFTGTV